MPRAAPRAALDYDLLAELLSALAYPMRLRLLQQLRFPHTLRDIRVSPGKLEAGGNPARPAAKPSVLRHLDRLVDAGLVRSEEVEQQGRRVPSYVVNAQRLYALTEDVRRLSVLYAHLGPGAEATGTLQEAGPGEEATGRRMVLVHGVYEGHAYALDAASQQEGRWVIGRKPGLAVSLDYDPYVSLENTAVEASGEGHSVTDLAGSKNGTSVNWRRMPRGSTRALRAGDVVGVGRSLLLFMPT